MRLSIIVPMYNEADNVAELLGRLAGAVPHGDVEILVVDDSTDRTPEVVTEVAASLPVAVTLIHRDEPVGGLSGAVIAGLRAARARVCVVMDGDLQHPPEDVPRLLARFEEGDADVVVASRYSGEGTSVGLAGAVRTGVSRLSTAITRAMFPVRMRTCTDPMTGFFLVDRDRVNLGALRPRGFKILLEILARQPLRVAEIPFHFADRYAGASKATFRQGIHFLTQLFHLRFGKMSGFAAIGAIGAVANVAIVWLLTTLGVGTVWAAVVAAEITIVGNFILFERFLFREMTQQARPLWRRFLQSFTFNNVEAAVRLPVVVLLVDSWHLSAALATAITLIVAFVARFLFHSLVVYAPRRPRSARFERNLRSLDEQVTSPGEV